MALLCWKLGNCGWGPVSSIFKTAFRALRASVVLAIAATFVHQLHASLSLFDIIDHIQHIDDALLPPFYESSESSVPPTTTPTTTPTQPTTTTLSRTNKYLKYGSTAGWANQVNSLEHAIWLADATRRTLVLPPILQQNRFIQWSYVDTTIDALYKTVDPYVPLTHILDFGWLRAKGIEVIDWNVFHQQTAASNLTQEELSYRYHCQNTKWTRNLDAIPEANRTRKIFTCEDHIGRRGTHEVTYRDMVTTLQKPHDGSDVLNFHFIYPSTGFDMTPDHQQPKFQLIYSEPIRAVAKSIRQRLWNDKPYAAIHIRARDGPYYDLFKEKPGQVIQEALAKVGGQIEEYYYRKNINNNSSNSNNNSSNNNTNTNSSTTTDNLTLLVLTDFKPLPEHKSWLDKSSEFAGNMTKNHGVHLSYVFGHDYNKEMNHFKKTAAIPWADGLVDMQLAICASVGFGHYQTSSTYLSRILSTRQQQRSSAC